MSASPDRLSGGEQLQDVVEYALREIDGVHDSEATAKKLYAFLKDNKTATDDQILNELGILSTETSLAQIQAPAEAIRGEFEEQESLKDDLSASQQKLEGNIFYTDDNYGGKKHFDALFASQQKELDEADTFEYHGKIQQFISVRERLLIGAEAMEATTKNIDIEFFADIADTAFLDANNQFFEEFKNPNPDCNNAVKTAEAVANNIREEQKKFNAATKHLNDPSRLERSVDHVLADEQNLLDLQNDPQKIIRLLRDRYGVEFDTRFVGKYLDENLVNPYIKKIEKAYQQQLAENKKSVAQAHIEILQNAEGQFFASKADYEAFVQAQMQARFPNTKNGKAKKYMPDSEWDRLKARNLRSTEQAWERRIDQGEKSSWEMLDEGLGKLKEKNFATEAERDEYFKVLGKKVSEKQYLPDEAWDDLVKDKFKEKATIAWEKHLETRSDQVWNTLDKALSSAESQKFHSKKELVSFIQKTTDELNTKKLIPDEYWNKSISKNLHAKVDTLWTARNAEKKKDSEIVKKSMQSVSLAHQEKPKSTTDFYRIAKKNLPKNIQGKLDDSEWNSHMRTYFYPRVKAQLKENETKVRGAMETVALPAASDYANQTAYLDAVKTHFANNKESALGQIPNHRYDVLRNRILINRGKDAWKAHEKVEASTLDKAREAMNDDNLIRTVHHFAKNKKNPNPTASEIKASSTHALQSQFKLRADQLKVLEPEIRSYAAQATALHKSRRRTAIENVKSYQVPDKKTFTENDLKTSKSFWDAMRSAVGDIDFIDVNDWYLVESEAMAHIEGLRQAQIKLAEIAPDAANDNIDVANDNEQSAEDLEKAQTEKSEALKEEVVENNGKHPAEQTEWMKRFGIPTESVSQKGVERFSRVMNLPEFNLGGIPKSDLKIAMPALVNMLGGFKETTWKNFTLKIRTDMRALDSKDPQSRFFQIIKSFATGYPYKLTDFDVVPGIDNVFNNLIKRTKGPEGEKFTTIKNLYKHYFQPEDREALDVEMTEEEFEVQMLNLMDEEGSLLGAEDVAEETIALIDEMVDTSGGEIMEEEETLLPVEISSETETVVEEDEEEIAEEVVQEIAAEVAVESTETEVASEIPTETIEASLGGDDQDQEEELLPVETVPEIEDQENEEEVTEASDVVAESEENLEPETVEPLAVENTDNITEEPLDITETVTEKLSTKESVTNPEGAFGDYLEEGAVVLTEVDQILRQPLLNEDEVEAKKEETLLEEQLIQEQMEEIRPEEQKSPIDEAAEVVPDKLHKALLKLSSMGLLSDEAISWLLEQSMEFAVVEDEGHLTLRQALKLVEISLQSQFLARNLELIVGLNQSVQSRVVTNPVGFIRDFTAQVQVVDGLQSIMVNAHRSGALRGYFSTRFGKKSFAVNCLLIRPKKSSNKLS